MNTWIIHPIILTWETVDLIPLDPEHLATLEALAKDKRIWEFYPFDGSDSNTFSLVYKDAFVEREKGNQYPFVIFHKLENKIIGSTRFLDIQPRHKKLEIGFTWLDPQYWATIVNIECKLLLLQYCFETIKAIRVQFKTDENNLRSRKAIEKIGGQFEGILRNDMLRLNNTKRNSAYYSITDDEWPDTKINLKALYESKKRKE